MGTPLVEAEWEQSPEDFPESPNKIQIKHLLSRTPGFGLFLTSSYSQNTLFIQRLHSAQIKIWWEISRDVYPACVSALFNPCLESHYQCHHWKAPQMLRGTQREQDEREARGELCTPQSWDPDELMTFAGPSRTLAIASPLFLNTQVKPQVKSTVSEPVLLTSHQPVQSRREQREAWDAPNFHFTDAEIKNRERDVNWPRNLLHSGDGIISRKIKTNF